MGTFKLMFGMCLHASKAGQYTGRHAVQYHIGTQTEYGGRTKKQISSDSLQDEARL